MVRIFNCTGKVDLNEAVQCTRIWMVRGVSARWPYVLSPKSRGPSCPRRLLKASALKQSSQHSVQKTFIMKHIQRLRTLFWPSPSLWTWDKVASTWSPCVFLSGFTLCVWMETTRALQISCTQYWVSLKYSLMSDSWNVDGWFWSFLERSLWSKMYYLLTENILLSNIWMCFFLWLGKIWIIWLLTSYFEHML